ncbi:hypothetical protein F5B18DRAFT_657420 [Nemania serpens]|nr:hypothetical protein F5B18DRAFT_657420 [Nemania serpens]
MPKDRLGGSLPPELLLKILSQLPDNFRTKSLCNLRLLSKYLLHWTTPLIFNFSTINLTRKFKRPRYELLKHLATHPSSLTLSIRHLSIESVFVMPGKDCRDVDCVWYDPRLY